MIPHRALRSLCAVVLVAAGVSLAPVPAHAQDIADKVKAAFLFNFARFTSWPPERLSEGQPMVLCVLGDADVGRALAAAVAGKQIESHEIEARLLEDLTAAEACHALLLPGNSAERVDGRRLAELLRAHVLIVHEADRVLPEGAIRLYVEDRRLRFEVNRAAAQRASLKISAKLLSLARIVEA